MEETEGKPIQVRIELEGDEAEKFEFLKKKFGLKNNVELCRVILSEAYEKYLTEKRSVILGKIDAVLADDAKAQALLAFLEKLHQK